MVRVADYIATYIYNLGVKNVFLLSGGGMMYLSDGIACHPRLKYVCCHHEQSAAMAAEAYGRVTGNYGAAYFTTGPGATNALTGVIGAWQDSAPCIFISGQAKRSQTIYKSGIKSLRQFGVQEVNIVPIVESVTKFVAFVDDPQMIRYYLEKAAYIAKNGRPGPVWLDIPLDVQGMMIDPKGLTVFNPQELAAEYALEISNEKIIQISDLIRSASRPVIIGGQGIRIAGAMAALKGFIEKYNIPLVTTRVGIDIIESNHPLFIGRPGLTGDRPANFAVQNADLVLVIGSRLSVSSVGHEYDKFARAAKVVVIDIDPEEHQKKTIRIDIFLKADAKKFINDIAVDLAAKGYQGPDKSWARRCLAWKKKYPVALAEYKNLKNKINMYYLVDRLCNLASNNSIIISDAGSAFYVTSQAVKIKKGQRYITSGAIATMGYTLPAAIGAAIAAPSKNILGITGDGSFQMNIQELQVLVHHGLPVKLFVFNNNGYLSIRNTQASFFKGRFIGEGADSGVSCPDTLKIAKAYGIKAVRVSQNSKLDGVIKSVLAYKGPMICEVMIPSDQLIIPKVSTLRRPDGTLVSKPLEDMFPFLDRDEFKANMIVPPVEEA